MNTNKAELKPCPFCGTVPVDANPFFVDERWHIYCDHCEAAGPDETDEAQAIKAWNERIETK
jgi:Lar family restriction alleviation protein